MRPSKPITWISASPCRCPISKSFGSCAGRHLERAGADRDVDVVVADDRHLALGERHDRGPADQVAEALVGRVHGDRRVAEQRHGPHGRDRDVTAPDERVVDLVHDVLDVPVLDLEIRDRGQQPGRPVDHAVRAEQVALAVEVDEDLRHRVRVALVHREALAPEVERRAEPQVLAGDGRAGLAPPLPHAVDEAARARARGASCPRSRAGARPPSAWRCPRGRCRRSRARCGRACGARGSARPGSCR